MVKLRSIALTVILCVIVQDRKQAFAQTPTPELTSLITQLQEPATSDKASTRIKALAGNDTEARLSLTKELPQLISKTSDDHSTFKVWVNSVHLAGDLKIEEAIPVLISELIL